MEVMRHQEKKQTHTVTWPHVIKLPVSLYVISAVFIIWMRCNIQMSHSVALWFILVTENILLKTRVDQRHVQQRLNSTWPASAVEYVPIASCTVPMVICPYRHGHSAAVPLCTRTTKQTDLYSSLHHAPTDLLEGAGSYLHFKNAVIKDASASPGQTSTAPCPVSVSYQPPDDTPSMLWNSTAVCVSEVTWQRMPLNALQWNGAPSLKMCLLSWVTDASLQNRQFEVDTLQNSHFLLLRQARLSAAVIYLDSGVATHTRIQVCDTFKVSSFILKKKICPERGIWWLNPAVKSTKSKATGGESFTRNSRRPGINFLSLL